MQIPGDPLGGPRRPTLSADQSPVPHISLRGRFDPPIQRLDDLFSLLIAKAKPDHKNELHADPRVKQSRECIERLAATKHLHTADVWHRQASMITNLLLEGGREGFSKPQRLPQCGFVLWKYAEMASAVH